MAGISNSMFNRINQDLKENPLKPDELRRIVGMGPHYIAMKPRIGDDSYMFELDMDGVKVYIYGAYVNTSTMESPV